MTEDAQVISSLEKEFKFRLELDATSDRVMFMRFEDGRNYRLEHPGAMTVARLFSVADNELTYKCLEYFFDNCIRPDADNKTKKIDKNNLDLDETLDLWLVFAWRFLRRGLSIAIK